MRGIEINEFEEKAQKYRTDLNRCIEKIEEIIDKGSENITESDVKEYKSLESEIYQQHSEDFKYRYILIEERINEVEETVKKYPLVDREDIISQEEDKELLDLQGTIQDLKSLEEIIKSKEREADKIIEEAQGKLTTDKKDDVMEFIKQPKEPVGIIMHVEDDVPGGPRIWNHDITSYERVVSDKVRALIEEYGAYDKNTSSFRWVGNHDREEYGRTIRFTEYKDCDLEHKQKIREYEQRVKQIINSDNEQYDKNVNIRINLFEKGSLKFETTQRELAKMGLSYDDLKEPEIKQSKQQGQLSSRDIAEADKEQSLTTTEVSETKGIINRIKGFFKGKGEK